MLDGPNIAAAVKNEHNNPARAHQKESFFAFEFLLIVDICGLHSRFQDFTAMASKHHAQAAN